MKVTFYTHDRCTLCADAESLLEVLTSIYNLEVEKRDIYTNDAWLEKYLVLVPVIDIAGKQFTHPHVTFEALSAWIEETMNHRPDK